MMDAFPNKTRARLAHRLIAATLVAIIAAWASTAAAQAFKSDEVKLTRSEAGRLNSESVEPVKTNVAAFQNPDSRRQFESYFTDYLFPSLTQTTAEGLRDIGRRRGEILRAFQGNIHDEAFQRLTSMTLEAMKRIATENYHPAARYNAMLIIGSLDAQPGNPTDANQTPPPLPEAGDFMLQMLEADASQAPDLVKLAAVIGLERHAATPLPDDKRKALTDELLTIITSQRPNYRTPTFHAWFQFRAVEAVTQLGELGENNRVHDALVAFMSDDSVPLTERMYAAKSLEKLAAKYTPDAGIDARATIAALGNVLADVMTEEKTEAYKFNQEQFQGPGYQQLLLGDEEPPGYGKGRFLQRINYVLDGFKAVEGALPADVKQEADAVVAQVDQLRTLALDRTAVEVALSGMIEQSADQIVEAAEGLGQDPAAAAPADDDGLGAFGAQPQP